VLAKMVNNYTHDHPYIWDEISLPVTYDSDWKTALNIIETVVDAETKEITAKSDLSVSKLADKYYLPKRATGPMVIVSLTSNWINFSIRYIAEVRQRRLLRDRLARRLLAELESAKNVRIASESFNISIREFPGKNTGA
jgi:small-conductance mechanosensitive channel